MSSGVIYAATGASYIRELLESAASLRAAMPDVSITISVDDPTLVEASDISFEKVIVLDDPEKGYGDKITLMQTSPYEKTVFLDTDTYIAAPFDDLFQMLDRFDIAAKLDGRRFSARQEHIPDAFPEYNSGVVAFRKCAATDRFFENWQRIYEVHKAPDWTHYYRERKGNQPAFRAALWESDIHIGTLGEEYNCQERSGFLGAPAKIIHGRNRDLPGLAAAYNFDPGKRVFMRRRSDFKVLRATIGGERYVIYTETRKNSLSRQINTSLGKRGFLGTVRFGWGKIQNRIKLRLGL